MNRAISHLLKQNQATTHSGADSFFAAPLGGYAGQVLADIHSLKDAGTIRSYDDLCTYTQCFNVGALIQYLLGDADRARSLAFSAIRFVRRVAKQAQHPEWNIQFVQPVINIARIFRAVGDAAGCTATLQALHRIVVLGKAGSVLDLRIDSQEAQSLSRFDAKARAVVIACERTETLKCAFANRDFETIRNQLCSHGARQPRDLEGSELEHLLKCELGSKSYNRLLTIVSELSQTPPWAYLYVIDTFRDAGHIKDARETAMLLWQRLRRDEDDKPEVLLYSLAVRFASLDDFISAEDVAVQALEASKSSDTEVVQLRIATLRAILAVLTHSSHRLICEAQHWDLLQRSRHNQERLLSCLTMIETEPSGRKYFRAASELLNSISDDLVVTRLAREQLKTCAREFSRELTLDSEAASLTEQDLPEARQVFDELTGLAETAKFSNDQLTASNSLSDSGTRHSLTADRDTPSLFSDLPTSRVSSTGLATNRPGERSA